MSVHCERSDHGFEWRGFMNGEGGTKFEGGGKG